MVIHHLDKASSKAAEEHRFRESDNSQWGPHAAQAMVDETRHFPLAIGTKKMTMGDLYDMTPQGRISKVMLEEKVFQTWHSGRTVLLGDGKHGVVLRAIKFFRTVRDDSDLLTLYYLYPIVFVYNPIACHKLNPSGGHGKILFFILSHKKKKKIKLQRSRPRFFNQAN